MKPRRPVLRYFGGKWKLAPWIISHFPEHRVYIEPFGGAASVLMQKPRTYAEIYNDIDGEVVNVFRVLRDPILAATLQRLLWLTPFARAEFNEVFVPIPEDPVEWARRTIFKSYSGIGSETIFRGARAASGLPTTGFRSAPHQKGRATPAGEWARYPWEISIFCARLQGVVIEQRPAIDVIRQYDDKGAFFYVDPPYVREACRRRRDHGYRHELTAKDHLELATVLSSIRGMAIVSGYPSELYEDIYKEWRTVEIAAHTGSKYPGHVREILWLSPNVPARAGDLFPEVPHA